LSLSVSVAIDAMGGDYGPRVTVPAAFHCLSIHPELTLIFIGNQEAIKAALPANAADFQVRYDIVPTDTVVAMDESPASALRNKKNSSMAVALSLVKEGRASACVSAGNTGALMMLGRSVLGTHEGIDRPAFITEVPTLNGHCHVLDLGANLDCTSKQLYQFALMGSIVSRAVDGCMQPRVGLLNVGREEIKGNELVKETAKLLKGQSPLNYIGFVEGDDIFSGQVDVVVCDGFVGNVALKASEGVAKMIGGLLKQALQKNLLTRTVGLLIRPTLEKLSEQINPKERNGASLLGLEGIVIKSHGNADVRSFCQAIKRATREVETNVPQLISDSILKHHFK
jgi:phosphate acyltransferase